jgi:hypothetical protein
MTEHVTDAPLAEPTPTDPTHSSRWSRAAAGWTDCVAEDDIRDLLRPGYRIRRFNWLSLRPLLESRNDRIARRIQDPTNDERMRWVAAMRAKGVDPDLVVRRFADRRETSFLVIGDPGEGDESQYRVLRPLFSKAGGTAFTFVVSDVIYPAGDVNEYEDKFFWPYRQLPGPIYAVPGNHDWYDGLHGFMTHFCQADPDARPPATGSGFRGRLRRLLWRRPSKPKQDLLERVGKLRAERSDQPGPYFAIDLGTVLLVGIDTGIQDRIDPEQGEWLRRISAGRQPKILVTGKPFVVDGRRKSTRIGGKDGPRVREIVDEPSNRYIAVIGGDVHNYQRYPVPTKGRVVQHIVSGAAGAYTKATHKIPPVLRTECGCTEEEFRCYPRRGDSLAAYSKLYARRFRWLGGSRYVIPPEQAPQIMSRLLAEELERQQQARSDGEGAAPPAPTRPEDQAEQISEEAWAAARRVTRFPGQASVPLHRYFSELLDWDKPPPPLFKSFLRVDVRPGEVEIRCFAATGCAEHANDPPLEDWLRARERPDGAWAWEVLLNDPPAPA